MARIILIAQVAGMAIGTVVIFYVLGFSERPHHVGLASVIASGYLVIMATSAWLIYHSYKRRAIRAVRAFNISEAAADRQNQ